jgi:hypothetical protein
MTIEQKAKLQMCHTILDTMENFKMEFDTNISKGEQEVIKRIGEMVVKTLANMIKTVVMVDVEKGLDKPGRKITKEYSVEL